MKTERTVNVNILEVVGKNIYNVDLQQIKYIDIEDALQKCRVILEQHQKTLQGKVILSNQLIIGGYSFIQT